jgi:ECF transporter S component (folate family)
MKEMFTSSAEKLKSIRFMAIMAIFIALKIVLGFFFIPVSENLRISPVFLLASIESAIIGPIAALVSGAITDIAGYLAHPTGPFFPGYTLSTMLGGFIYGLFLYRQRITILKLSLAKLIVNAFVNVLLGSLWSAMMFSKGYMFYAAKSIVKNSMMLPIEIILMTLLFNFIIPFLEKKRWIERKNTVPLPWI